MDTKHTMNAGSSRFLDELDAVEGIDIPVKLPPVYFQEQLDEVRDKLSKTARRELNALHGIATHERRDKYGLAQSSWWKEDASGRIQITLRDGAKVIELVEGKGAWMLGDVPSACRFLAAAIEAIERKELDRFLTVKPKKAKVEHYKAYLRELREHRRKAQAEQVIGDVSQMPMESSNG